MTPNPPGPLGPGKPIVTAYRQVNRGALVGEFKLMFWHTLVISLDYFKTESSRWANYPARTFPKKSGGGLGRVPLLEFANPEINKQFQDAALAAIDGYLQATEPVTPPDGVPNPMAPPITDEEVPS